MKYGFMMIGVPGCGKTTISNYICSKLSNVSISSLDTYRLDFFKSKNIEQDCNYNIAWEFANSNKIEFDKYVNQEWNQVLKAQHIIVDNTNLTYKSRAHWISGLRSKKFDKIIGINILIPLQLAIDRQKTRTDKFVSEKVIREMYFRHQEVLVNEVDILCNINGRIFDTKAIDMLI